MPRRSRGKRRSNSKTADEVPALLGEAVVLVGAFVGALFRFSVALLVFVIALLQYFGRTVLHIRSPAPPLEDGPSKRSESRRFRD